MLLFLCRINEKATTISLSTRLRLFGARGSVKLTSKLKTSKMQNEFHQEFSCVPQIWFIVVNRIFHSIYASFNSIFSLDAVVSCKGWGIRYIPSDFKLLRINKSLVVFVSVRPLKGKRKLQVLRNNILRKVFITEKDAVNMQFLVAWTLWLLHVTRYS